MEVSGRHIVVTGGAGGIGRALIRRLSEEGARALVVADRDLAGAQAMAGEVGGLAVELDAGRESSVRALIDEATAAHGPIDVFISNAGVPGALGGPEAADEAWDEAWRVNVMAHVWAARALLPQMLERGEGYLINTASAAGLLTQVSSLVYSVTKHAAVSLAEWLSIEYADSGVRVSCICPQGVRTPMLELAMEEPVGAAALASGGLIEPEDVADSLIEGMRDERMLILPHENVAGFMAFKGSDPERWLKGMRRLVRNARAADSNSA
ncbi:MAG: benD [Solirubrobacterales bacterium]|nr:benD [Solirubrobacterales bacterium]